MKRLLEFSMAVLALAAATCGTAAAQSYPAKTVRIVVPQAPGGSTDTQARLVAKKLQERLGQNFLVDNRPGASTVIGADYLVRSPPDGSTYLFISGTLAAIQTVKKVAYDPVKDLAPVTQL